MLYLLLALFVFVIWCLFITKSAVVGKHLYAISNAIGKKVAGLHTEKRIIDNETFVYYTNNKPNKPYMLLLHGFSADKNIWLKFAKHAGKDYQLIIPDSMGHGDIEYNSEQNYSAYEQAKYVARLIRDLHLDGEISIVGNSMGGMMAAILGKYQLTKPEYSLGKLRLDKLVLLDPAGAKSDFAKIAITQQQNPFVHMHKSTVFDFYKLAMNKPPFMPDAVLSYLAQTSYLDKSAQYAHMFTDFFNVDEFLDSAFDVPAKRTVLVWGDKDGLLPVSDAKLWQQMLVCEVHILPNIGHMPMVEVPQDTYRLVG